MLTVDQAIGIIARFRAAAPPGAAEKLESVMELLRHLDLEMAYLNTQLQEALEAATQQPPPAPMVVTEAPGETRPRRLFGERTVTDQLADIFDAISTAESPSVPMNGATTSAVEMYPLGHTAYPHDGNGSGLSSGEAPIYTSNDPSDPMHWLKEALPHLLLSGDLQEKLDADALQAKSLKQTAPILDLLTPLQESLRPSMLMVRAQSERLQSGKMGRLTTEQSVSLRSIRDQADSALSLVDSVGQILAVQQGRLRVDLSVVDTTDLVQRAIGMMQPSARARENQLLFNKPEKPLIAYADFEIALMIMIDLLDNAIRYAPVGGVTRVTIDKLGSHLLINVADSGIGLTEADFTNVGKPFWRATYQQIVRDNPGSGLRLYLAQRLLALQNGELIFSGEQGMGSTFSFTLPAVGEV
jgi:hypothetical protein